MEKIQLVREALKLKQKEFSTALEISQSYLSAMETGRKQITSKLANILFKKFNVSPEWFYNDNGNIFNITMGNTDGVNDGVNLIKLQGPIEYNGFKDSTNVKKVISFWNFVTDYDKLLGESLDALNKLEGLKMDLSSYLIKIDDKINEVLLDVQSVDYKELESQEYINNAVKKLSFLKDQHHTIDQLNNSIESVLVFIDHEDTAQVIGGNPKV